MKASIYNETTAPKESKELLAGVKSAYGFVPNLLGEMAESAPVLEAYLQLGTQLGKTSLSAQEQQVLYLTANYENNCHYCMAAHSTIAKGIKLPEHILTALREGKQLDDQKLDALSTFTRKVVQERGWVKDEDVQSFLSVGYTQANVLDVVLGVAHKTISNYLNHIFETPVDKAFEAQSWSK